jgi:hypothetical protein
MARTPGAILRLTFIVAVSAAVLVGLEDGWASEGAKQAPTRSPSPKGGYLVKVNCGGPAVDGLSADQAYTPGGWGHVGGSPSAANNAVAGDCGYPTAMKTARCSGGTLEYRFDVPRGVYDVRLCFAEPSFDRAGDRRFNLSINGVPRLTNFDVYAEAGGRNRGIQKVYSGISVTGGQLVLRLGSTTGTTGGALVNVLEVQQDASAVAAAPPAPDPGVRWQTLDGQWQIAKDPKDTGKAQKWHTAAGFPLLESRPIQVPGNIYESWCRYNGVAWYSRTFAPAMLKAADMRYYLRVGSCEYSCDIWLNGVLLGSHEGASSPFEFDVTDHLLQGENFLAIRVFSPGSTLWKGTNYPVAYDMGGLTQHVTLAAQPKTRVADVFVRPDWRTGNAPLEITLENCSGATAAVRLHAVYSEHKSGKPSADVTADVNVPPGQSVQKMTATISPPHLWSLEDPFLYTVKVTADSAGKQDVYVVPHVGFRDFRINEFGYFELNGKRIFLKCTHSNVYDPVSILGTSRDMKYVTPDFAKMKNAGFNTFREIIYSALPEQLDQADEAGYLIYNEHQASWVLKDASKFAVDLPGVIKRDRNHPCLAIWGLLNETGAGPAYNAAKNFLPVLRKLDDTRLVLLSSGRWDGDRTTGSASNPSSTAWDVDIGDVHIYPSFPTDWSFVTSTAKMADNPRPTFVSEGGIGSSYNAFGEKRKLQQAGAANDGFAWGWINPMIQGLENAWAKYRLQEVYPSIEDMLIDSQKLAARERAMWFSILRSNPKVNGYSLTGHSDYWGYAEGVTDTFNEFKADHLPVMQGGWSKLCWCLLVNPMNVYADQAFRVRVALANEGQLAPGRYPARLSISGPSGEIWHKETTIAIQGGRNPPLAYAVLDEDVKAAGLSEGKYTLAAALASVPNASASQLEFTVTEKRKHPDLAKTTVTVLGLSQGVKDLLTSRGATLRDYAAGQTFDKDVIVVGEIAARNAATWRPLYQRIARGAHAIFLSPAAFNGGPKNPNKWLALGQKGTRTKPGESLYHSDTIAKNHAIMSGLPTKVMTPDGYPQLLGGEFFGGVTVPDETVVVRVYCTTATTWDGLMVGTYKHHAGRFTVNAFDLIGNLGNPAADRMLLNMAAYAGTDAAAVQPLPANYDMELTSLGIADEAGK